MINYEGVASLIKNIQPYLVGEQNVVGYGHGISEGVKLS